MKTYYVGGVYCYFGRTSSYAAMLGVYVHPLNDSLIFMSFHVYMFVLLLCYYPVTVHACTSAHLCFCVTVLPCAYAAEVLLSAYKRSCAPANSMSGFCLRAVCMFTLVPRALFPYSYALVPYSVPER